MKKIDLIDKKLLFELDMNARATNAELAKALRISKQSVQYRIHILQKRGVIKGFYTVLDFSKIGFLYVRFFVKFKDITKEIENEIINYCVNNHNYSWIVSIDGRWDLAIVFLVDDYVRIKELADEFLSHHGTCVDSYEISIATRIDHLQNRFFLEGQQGRELSIGGKLCVGNIDELDRKVISELAVNARARLNTIAAELGVSYKVVSYRIQSLLKQGIIKLFRVDIDYNAMGFTHYKIFVHLKDFKPEHIQGMKSFIASHPNTIYITEAIGLAELEFEVIFDAYSKLHDLLQQMRTEFPAIIKDHYSVILYKFYRINYFPTSPDN